MKDRRKSKAEKFGCIERRSGKDRRAMPVGVIGAISGLSKTCVRRINNGD